MEFFDDPLQPMQFSDTTDKIIRKGCDAMRNKEKYIAVFDSSVGHAGDRIFGTK